jgi:putative oxidoreductase
MNKWNKYGLWAATSLVALYVGTGGGAKLAGVRHVHASFAEMGLPGWFGYFIGACELLGAAGLFIRPFSALAAAGIAAIMAGALYYHLTYTPIAQALPALVLILLGGYIFMRRRAEILKFK